MRQPRRLMSLCWPPVAACGANFLECEGYITSTPPLAEKERALISQRTKQGLAAAKRRGVKLGGWTAGSERSAQEAAATVERMRPVMRELADLSSLAAATELNRRGIKSATGGKWHAATVIRLRERLNQP
jgi:hypothetical protein